MITVDDAALHPLRGWSGVAPLASVAALAFAAALSIVMLARGVRLEPKSVPKAAIARESAHDAPAAASQIRGVPWIAADARELRDESQHPLDACAARARPRLP
jgi:hypothetical protein